MLNGLYLFLVILVAFAAIFAGFRKGITGQIASLLGFGFGAVAARIVAPQITDRFEWVKTFTLAPEFNEFAVNLVTAIVVYTIIFWIFSIFSKILQGALSVFNVGMFNRLLGGFFSLVKNMLWLSIFFNLLICFSSSCGLLQYERANDGNLVAAVMDLTPSILGCYGGEDFAHFHQLKEAKSISFNYNTPHCHPDSGKTLPPLSML